MFCKLKQVLKLILPLKIQKYIKKKNFISKFIEIQFRNKKESKICIFEYRKLSADMNLYTKEYGYNSFYGLADIVKKILGISQKEILSGAIEHGIVIGNGLTEVDTKPDIIYALE